MASEDKEKFGIGVKDNHNHNHNKDLTKQKVYLKIQEDRVLYIINKCLIKLNTLVQIPKLLENNGEILRRFLAPKELYFVLSVLREWGINLLLPDEVPEEDISDHLRLGTVNRSSRKQALVAHLQENFPNPRVYQLLDILNYNKCIQNLIRVEGSKRIQKPILLLMKNLQQLRQIAKNKIKVTGEQEKVFERELRRVYKVNIALNGVHAELKAQLEKQRKDLGKQLEDKIKIYEKYEQKRKTVTENFRMDIKKTLRDSERQMMQVCIESEDKQGSLAEKAEEIVQKYENILHNDLEEEKKARSKRLKIQAQLQQWINTFDQDISDKQFTLEALLDEFNDIKNQKETMEQMLVQQDEVYEQSMREKAEEEERLFNEMAYQLYLERCAKKIQKFWRMYVAKKMMKKKKRKKK